MNKNLILVVVLAVLVIVSAVQTVQLVGLKSKLGSGIVGVSTGSSSAPQVTVSGGQSSGAGSLADLPSMVGGC